MTTSSAPAPTVPTAATTATTSDPTAVVEAFLAALEAQDIEAARSLMATEIAYRNVPFPAARGRAAAERVLQGFLRVFRSFEVEMLHIAADGPVVLTERVDTLATGSVRVRFWVCGTFEVHDGRITVWRDRFDLVDVGAAVLRGLALAPLRR